MSQNFIRKTRTQRTILCQSSLTETLSSISVNGATGSSLAGYIVGGVQYFTAPLAPASQAYLSITFGGTTADTVFTVTGSGSIPYLGQACPRNAGTPNNTINIVPVNCVYTVIIDLIVPSSEQS